MFHVGSSVKILGELDVLGALGEELVCAYLNWAKLYETSYCFFVAPTRLDTCAIFY